MKKLILLLLLTTCVLINAQQKFIVYGLEPVVDPYTKEIYYYQYYQPEPGAILLKVRKTNLTGDYEIDSDFTSVPVFANNSHRVIYTGFTTLRVINGNPVKSIDYCNEYNFETGISDTLFTSDYPPNFIPLPNFYFPDDKNICFPSKVYNFEKDSLIVLNENPGFLDSDNFYYQPNSDSTFLAIINKERQIGDFHHLLQVNINTLFIDTLYSVQVEDNKQMLLSAFAYNAAKELLAINISYNWQSTLYIYDYSDSVKNLIYSSELFDNEPALMITEYMEWSPENDKLILLGYPVTGFGCAADLFKLEDTTRVELWHSGTFNAPEPYYSEHLWYDNEIIIYRGKGSIYSYNIDKETSLDEHEINLVPEFLALKNYPNPFNQSTVISYQLPSFSQVKLSIYDLLGREVAELMNEQKPAGKYKVIFNANNFSSGVYIYRLTTDNQSISKKMLLTK